jgi:hypothetical protein
MLVPQNTSETSNVPDRTAIPDMRMPFSTASEIPSGAISPTIQQMNVYAARLLEPLTPLAGGGHGTLGIMDLITTRDITSEERTSMLHLAGAHPESFDVPNYGESQVIDSIVQTIDSEAPDLTRDQRLLREANLLLLEEAYEMALGRTQTETQPLRRLGRVTQPSVTGEYSTRNTTLVDIVHLNVPIITNEQRHGMVAEQVRHEADTIVAQYPDPHDFVDAIDRRVTADLLSNAALVEELSLELTRLGSEDVDRRNTIALQIGSIAQAAQIQRDLLFNDEGIRALTLTIYGERGKAYFHVVDMLDAEPRSGVKFNPDFAAGRTPVDVIGQQDRVVSTLPAGIANEVASNAINGVERYDAYRAGEKVGQLVDVMMELSPLRGGKEVPEFSDQAYLQIAGNPALFQQYVDAVAARYVVRDLNYLDHQVAPYTEELLFDFLQPVPDSVPDAERNALVQRMLGTMAYLQNGSFPIRRLLQEDHRIANENTGVAREPEAIIDAAFEIQRLYPNPQKYLEGIDIIVAELARNGTSADECGRFLKASYAVMDAVWGERAMVYHAGREIMATANEKRGKQGFTRTVGKSLLSFGNRRKP